MKKLWTIGHSTHPFEIFIRIIKSQNIECLADIRGLPGSRRYPQFNKENLITQLPVQGIEYVHLSGLGGRRKTRKDSVNTGWRNDAFRGYADYMQTDEFRVAADELMKLADKQRTAIMCAEVLWWRCHRSLVSDYFLFHGWEVVHITGDNKTEPHRYSSPARVIEGMLTYPGEKS